MAYQLTQEAVIEGKSIEYVDAPFDKGHRLITSRNGKIITGRDLAHARIQTGAKHSLSKNGSYIREGILYSQENPLLLSVSSILENAGKTTRAHQEDEACFPDAKIVENCRSQAEKDRKKDPQDRRVLILAQTENFEIPTNRFNEEEVTLWLFKDQAKAYGDYLKANDIEAMPVWLAGKSYTNDQKKPFERQLWLHRLGSQSGLGAGNGGLSCVAWLRGVSRGTVIAEGDSQKISESYTSEEIAKAAHSLDLNRLREGRLENLLIEELRKLQKL